MNGLNHTFSIFWKSASLFLRSLTKFLSRLFFVDLWRNDMARPVLLYALFIVLLGTFLFHWLEKWSYLDSLYFVIITLTTIGYGDYAPTTAISKILTIFYGLNGIVLLLVLFDLVRRVRGSQLVEKTKQLKQSDNPRVKKMADRAQRVVESSTERTDVVSAGLPKPRKPKSPFEMLKNALMKLFLVDLAKDVQSRGILLYAGVLIAVGALAFHGIEKWSWLNSVYFMFITMTTIGYGDFSPDVPWGKVLTIFFGLNGIVVLLSLYDRIRTIRWKSKLTNDNYSDSA